MTKIVIGCIAALVSCLFMAGRGFADPSKSTGIIPPSAVYDQYAQINAAIMNHDLAKIMSYFTSDFTETSPNGNVIDRDQERSGYQDELNRIKSMQIHYEVQNIVTTPTGTYCDVHFHMDGLGYKRVLFLKINGTFSNDLMVHDLWVSTPDGPRLKARQTLLNQTKVAAN